MAMNRNMTVAEKEIRDFAQKLMERAEQREGITFTEEQKEQVLDYAAMIGDDYNIRQMVRNLASAVRTSDEEKINEILWDARDEIDSFPDRSVGMAELKGYGYTADDMFPLRQEAALEQHRVGEKVYCLQPDGTHGEYASQEMILGHEGLFGIEKEAWQRIMEQDDERDYEEMGFYKEPMTDLDKEEALKMYDAGEKVYLITTFPSPIAVRERMEIERGPEHYQMEREAVERIRRLEQRMQEYPQIRSLKEAKLLLGSENRYGIYQIIDESPGREYEFMDMDFIERHGYQVKKEDYQLIYSDELHDGDTLESMYEKFNIAHPADYTGHSLSVSDIVVLNEDGDVKSYFVDSISFRELPDFLHLEPEMDKEEVAYRIGDQFFAIQVATEGYDYSFYDKEYKLIDGGVLDDPDISMSQAIQDILEDEGLERLERIPVDYDELQEKVEEVEAEIMQEAIVAYKPLAKVEELEEANYNMIDNVLNNMPPKKEPYLEYYAAECDEYHNMANFYKSENLEEILAKYREIIDDPSLSYFGNGMGIIYRNPNDTFYDEAEVSLVTGKSIHGDNLDQVAFMASLPIVHEALKKIVEAFPDFRYYPPKEIEVHYYPEKMTADELAVALNELAEDFDPYDYRDNFNPEEDMVETVALELRCGNAHIYMPFLKDVVEEECEESGKAAELLEKLKAYQPELPETAVPVVHVNFCEDKDMKISGYQKLESLDMTTAEMDTDLSSRLDPKTGMPEKTVQMYFTIYYPEDNRMKEIKGKINIGDGHGGIISQLKNQNEMKLTDESWLNYQKAKGDETFQAYIADLTDMQEHVLPYLQSFCSLEEKAPEKVEGVAKSTVQGERRGTEKVEVDKGSCYAATKVSDTKERKSIHERLKINKEIIAKQQGKDSKEKGVELA